MREQQTPRNSVDTTSSVSTAAQPDAAQSVRRVRLDRRALLRAGASSAPVLLTLASAPVAANTCVVASSFVSVATFKSRNPTTTSVQCTTVNCEYFRDLSPPLAEMSLKVGVAREDGAPAWLCPTASGYNAMTLSQVMPVGVAISKTGELGVLQHLITLSLCVSKGYHTGMGNVTKEYLVAIWQNYKSNGNFYMVPASGLKWSSGDLIRWLRYQIYAQTL